MNAFSFQLRRFLLNNRNSINHLSHYGQINRSQSYNTVRLRHTARINTMIVFVPQQEAWIIERMGRFNRILGTIIFIKKCNLFYLNIV